MAIGVPLGVYGRWAGWGFGLGWWGRPTPARVIEVHPARPGPCWRGHSEQSLVEQSHRVVVELEVEPPAGEPYAASSTTWQQAGDQLAGGR